MQIAIERPLHARRHAHELSLVCSIDALNIVRKHLFNALREIGLDANQVIVNRGTADACASLAALIRCRPSQDAQLQALAETLRHHEGVSTASWRTSRRDNTWVN
ncbi:hypothetical protein WM40_08700 [Robbsia andropogonis]|uniref:Uncharacterized protein n=1 Tax=Robbsia andropogonis TaxID=28092 RepID=A0A0F5K1N0_9BURK|nr:hypothetical protein [Robbsia andropogonis]KKB63784.1 hypothetical protein WM40_08700 [Robbsia andropogonis]MCP1116522.1 hypothetical protein [Robbsia andropogonis]MCP1126799.1 hypothetical protein [Robbsia andropogonis]